MISDNYSKLAVELYLKGDKLKKLGTEILLKAKECEKIQEKFLYKITMKSCDEEKLYYSNNENLLTDVLDAIELEYKFIPFGNDLLINVDEIIAIEKVGE